ncbi:hypothetical protein ACWHA1_27130 [Streptomyces decoyicus]
MHPHRVPQAVLLRVQQVVTRGLALLIVGRLAGDGRPAKRPELLPYEG